MIFVLNKSELLTDDEVLDRVDYLMLAENKKWVSISALTGKGIDKLEESIKKKIQNDVSENNRNVGVKTYGN